MGSNGFRPLHPHRRLLIFQSSSLSSDARAIKSWPNAGEISTRPQARGSSDSPYHGSKSGSYNGQTVTKTPDRSARDRCVRGTHSARRLELAGWNRPSTAPCFRPTPQRIKRSLHRKGPRRISNPCDSHGHRTRTVTAYDVYSSRSWRTITAHGHGDRGNITAHAQPRRTSTARGHGARSRPPRRSVTAWSRRQCHRSGTCSASSTARTFPTAAPTSSAAPPSASSTLPAA